MTNASLINIMKPLQQSAMSSLLLSYPGQLVKMTLTQMPVGCMLSFAQEQSHTNAFTLENTQLNIPWLMYERLDHVVLPCLCTPYSG